jgi:hypothetical protein
MSEFPSRELAEVIARWRGDPELFVREAFPWGEEGTALASELGPDVWQLDILRLIRDRLSPDHALRIAVASGHGVGKSALVAWILLWGMTTEVDTMSIVTANTATQLATKTWPELSKWLRLSPIMESMFDLTATSLASKERPRKWRLDQIPWSENRTEAFAGLHNKGRRILAVFDEASAIPDVIFETTEGALTDANTEIIWLVCGNPTRNTGRFRECFERFRNRWITRQVDSRTARITNKEQIKSWIEDYGEDSDFVRVRVKGEFPRAGSMQFIGSDIVDAATRREVEEGKYAPVVMGVDVARFGADASVIYIRRGRDARNIKPIKLRGEDTMTVAARVAEEARKYQCDQIFVDGGGVIDRLRQLRHDNVVEVNFGSKPIRNQNGQDASMSVYFNRRAEMWGLMKEWLEGGAIPNDPELISDLTNVEYGYRLLEGRDAIQLERKEDMRSRGLASPDIGDALALTFAMPVEPSRHSLTYGSGHFKMEVEYDPLAYADNAPQQPALPRTL